MATRIWREEVEKALHRVAEEDGHDGRWLHRALTSLDSFDRRSRLLGARLAEDMPIVPKRRKRRGKKTRRAVAKVEWYHGSYFPGRVSS